MSCLLNRYYGPVLVTLIGALAMPALAQAQSITPIDTTTVQQTGNQYQIDGGSLSGDGATLFHSFDQFNLLTGESAQFGNPATVENIIGRVVGSNASIIDGLLAVDGNASLYLLNPAGVFFGEHVQLRLGGSFSASTATGLNFGDQLLDVLGSNNYALLQGAPTSYVFNNEQASAVVNMGDLSVASGQSLTLLGGQTINTGKLSAPNGEVLVMAVPGENRVRLSQTGSLLNLELETLPDAVPTTGFSATAVPALLTGANNLGMATHIIVNPDGTLSLSDSSLQIPANRGTTIVGGQLAADSGAIAVLGEQVALVGGIVDVSGDDGGGTVLIGGAQLGNGPIPNAATTVIDQTSAVRADAREAGDGGKIVVWGDRLLRSTGQLSAQGGINGGGGFVETSSLGQLEVSTPPDISAPDDRGGLWLLDPANIRIVRGNGATNISATNPFVVDEEVTDALLGVDLIEDALEGGANVEIRTTGNAPGNGDITLETALLKDGTEGSSLSFIATGDINLLDRILSDDLANLTVQADGSINVGNNIRLQGDGTGELGNLTLLSLAGDVDVAANFVEVAGTLSITAAGDVIAANSVDLSSGAAISSNQGSVDIGNLKIISINGGPRDGDIAIAASENINIREILATVTGDITLSAENGSINVFEGGSVSSIGSDIDPTVGAGDIILQALNGSVTLGVLATGSTAPTNRAGSISVDADSIFIGDSPLEDNQIFLDTVRDDIHLHTLGIPILDSQTSERIGLVTGLASSQTLGQLSPFLATSGKIEIEPTTSVASSAGNPIGNAESLPDFVNIASAQPLVLQADQVPLALPIVDSQTGQTLGQTIELSENAITGEISGALVSQITAPATGLLNNIEINPTTGEVIDLATGEILGQAVDVAALENLTAGQTIELLATQQPADLSLIDSSTGQLVGQITGLSENLLTDQLINTSGNVLVGQITNPATGLVTDVAIDPTTGVAVDPMTGDTVGQIVGVTDLATLTTDQDLAITLVDSPMPPRLLPTPPGLLPTPPTGLPMPPTESPDPNAPSVPITDENEPSISPEAAEQLANCISDCHGSTATETVGQTFTGEINVLPAPELALKTFERRLTPAFVNHLGLHEQSDTDNSLEFQDERSGLDLADLSTAQAKLLKAQGQTGKRPALIYAVFGSSNTLTDDSDDVLRTSLSSDPLELLLVTAEGEPKYVQLPATRGEVLELAHRFRRQVTSPSRVGTKTYLPMAQQLYQLLIAPLEAELAAQEIDTISFITDAGLRSLPIAALHDGENFLIKNYNVGLMPSLSLTDLTYQDLTNVSALVAGTSVFADQIPLPSVPMELDAISSNWRSELLQGDTFSLNKLQGERQQNSYGILHLATHGEFNPGDLSKSYLHLHNEKLGLDQLRKIGLHRPAVELITLSACQTALGSRSAELGFAGFAVLAGAKTAVASLWSVDDQASAGLMIEFYRQLQEGQPTIKAEALRRAQLAMIQGEITVADGQLNLPTNSRPLPAALDETRTQDFSHPYYWAAFSLIGSPW